MSSKLPEYFLKERFQKDLQYFTIYEHFRPNYKIQNVARKFYSSQTEKSVPDPKILQQLRNAKSLGPRQKHEWPETVNQSYGWYPDPFILIDKNDIRFWNPKILCPETRHELKVKAESLRDPKFAGVPFKL